VLFRYKVKLFFPFIITWHSGWTL